jgi:hypothetical protein
LVDDGGDVKALEEWGDECEGTEVKGVVVESGSMPGVRHRASAGKDGSGSGEAGSEGYSNGRRQVKCQAARWKIRSSRHGRENNT